MKQARKRATQARDGETTWLPAYTRADGVLSFRYDLTDDERAIVDQALRIVSRHLVERELADSATAVKAYLSLQLGGEPLECFAVMFLDRMHRTIAFERLFSGSLDQTSVYPRVVVEAALRHRAASVVLAHNHPSGDITPSEADKALTRTMRAALDLVDVRLLDHVVVSGHRALSMAEVGML